MKHIITPILCISAAMCSLPAMASDAVLNRTTGAGYSGFKAAWDAAQSGDVLVVNQDVTISSVMNPTGRKISVEGASRDIKIQLSVNNKGEHRTAFQIKEDNDGAISLSNLTIAGADSESNTNLIQALYGTLTMSGVTVENFRSSVATGAIRLYGSVSASLHDVVFINCAMPADAPYEVNFAVSGAEVSGGCRFCANLTGNNTFISGAGLTPAADITLMVTDSRAIGGEVVKGCTDMSAFSLVTPTPHKFMLAPKGTDLVALAYKPVLLINSTADGYESSGFDQLAGKSGAIPNAADGALILINEDIAVTSTINPAVKVTLRGNSPTDDHRSTLFRNVDNNFINATAATSDITLENLAIDGSQFTPADGLAGYKNWIVNATAGHVSMNNVTIKSINNVAASESAAPLGFIRNLNSGSWQLRDVLFSDCSIEGDKTMYVIANAAGCAMSGDNNFSLRLGSDVSVDASGITNTTPIQVTISQSANGNVAFTGCSDPARFDLATAGWNLFANNQGGLSLFRGTPEPIVIPAFTAEGASIELPTLLKVARGSEAVLTFDVPAGVRLEYMITPFDSPAAQADADEWLEYTAPVSVAADHTVNLRAYDTENTWRIPAESYINILSAETILTGITDVTAQSAEPAYYTLQGVRVAADALTPGLYIRRTATTTEKILIR